MKRSRRKDWTNLINGTSALKLMPTTCESCVDCKHRITSDAYEPQSLDYCKHEPERTFDNDDDYEICSMFEQKNITFDNDLPEPIEDELPF